MSISVAGTSNYSAKTDPYYEHRLDLTAAFRWFARLNMHESVANHLSYAVSEDGQRFLINPNGRHFSSVRASELLMLDATDDATMNQTNAPDPSAWAIHGALHRNVPQARCLIHLHPKYATAFAAIEENSLPPIDQNTMRFHNRLAVDTGFGGMGLGDEAERLSTTIGDKNVLVMGNHGALTVGKTVAEAFDLMYYFERACETYITALSTGKPLRRVSDEVAETTARQWDEYGKLADYHLREVREILDREEPEYRL